MIWRSWGASEEFAPCENDEKNQSILEISKTQWVLSQLSIPFCLLQPFSPIPSFSFSLLEDNRRRVYVFPSEFHQKRNITKEKTRCSHNHLPHSIPDSDGLDPRERRVHTDFIGIQVQKMAYLKMAILG
jgi:hypothetical protein